MITRSSSAAKVADQSVKLFAIDAEGRKQEMEGLCGQIRLNALTNKALIDTISKFLKLLEHEQVHAILEPQGSTDEIFVAELARRAQVPIISFAATGSALSGAENPYFIKTSVDDSVQARALAAICHGFGWKEVVILYEDTEFGYQFLPHLSKAFRDVDIGLAHLTAIPASAQDSHLLKDLSILKNNQTSKVFLVHMNASLGSRLFVLAKKEQMLSEGYAWIITDSLSNFLNFTDPVTCDSMEGVVGIRPYVPFSEDLVYFQERWEINSTILKINNKVPIMDLNVHGLWAYDSLTALANAVEKIGPANPSSLYERTMKNTNLRISSVGPRLQRELSSTRFRGLSGDFQLVDGKLKVSAFEIFNVNRTGERTLGFWTPERGITGELSSSGEAAYLTSTEELEDVVWPGGSLMRPKGWSIPPSGILRVGVPCKPGNEKFVDILAIIDPVTHEANVTGFAIDIFLKAKDRLPYPLNPVFYCYNGTNNTDWDYDDMLHGIPEKYDMVVADVTIWAPRTSYVDFSLPYLESGSVLVVKKKVFGMWSFTMPLKWDLWLAIALACIFMGIVIWILERRVTTPAPGEESVMTNKGTRMTYLAPVAVLAFQERNVVSNKWSFFVLVCWLFMALILMQSFTANLSAILTVDQLKFAFSEDYHLGYYKGSFIKKFLIENLNIDESRLMGYYSQKDFHDAMRIGSKGGGIDAMFDEIPYVNLFLNQYSDYKIVGPTYRTDGLGFAFPVGSPLAANFSREILNVIQDGERESIEIKYFGAEYSSSLRSQGTSSLTFHDFAGLFITVASVAVFAVICSETAILNKLSNITRHFFHNVDGEIGDLVENANDVSTGVDRIEEYNGEQELPQDGDHDEIVEVTLNNEADVVQDVGGEINNHLARNLYTEQN
ncbi:hypothetical protein DH2020_006453 [Rehmannia glutinosa]|uniref:Glutamate receptor n=1 Tax=Rehmannia glutinosa TaxID=99300 RepID=A0ABR0XIW1_REHGL